ncbi:MAG TPA: 30S ribosomal protein S1 [Candidatus Limnocylindrales bacterium]|nr:30S ribosomal protein S1 [Candidatus Limnocylindrales bacterium]
MTEEQQGGPTPEPEASASVADQASDETVAAVAVADEPATSTDEADTTPEAESTPTADASAATADDDAPAATAESIATADDDAPTAEAGAVAEAPVSTADDESAATPVEASLNGQPASASQPAADTLTADETADAPAASDDEEEPAPARDLGPEPTTMEELLAEQDSDIKSFKHGDVVEGQVVRIDKDEILVDIGAKSEGVVSNRELFGRHGEGQPELSIGDTVLVYVLQPESPEGHVVLSLRRAGLERKWRAMQEQFEAGVIIEAPVIDHNKGGLIVDCGIRGFVPISQIVDFPRRPQNDQPRDAAQEIAEKLMPFVGRKLRLKILEVNRKANRLILSEKVALYEERREKRDELFSSLQVGQKVTGTVRSIAPFGVFIDLGGIDGLVHKSELSWNKVNNPESGYHVGEEVEAEVIDINHERGRISLSIRRLQPDPWHSTVADFKVGDIIDGTVTKLVNFGAFVRVRDGLEGLIHISELSHQRVAHPGDVVHEGQSLKLKIISLDSERHRLGLSLKQAEEPPARPVVEPGAPSAPSAPGAPRPERRPRPERSYSMSDAVQEPEGGIDNTLASAFAQVRQQLAAAEVDDVVETVAADEAAEEAAATEAVEEIVETVAADEAAEEAAAAEVVAEVEAMAGDDDAVEEAGAAAAIADLNATVAADEAALEASAAAEIDRLVDAAAANEDNEAAATEDAVKVVEAVATEEAMEEEAADETADEILGAVADDEATEADATADEVATIDDAVATDEAAEEASAEAAIETIVETVAADEAAEEAAAGEAIEEIARETMEANTEG